MEMEEPDALQILKRDEQETEVDGDVSVWARLPEELIETVLTFLPVPSLIRAGIVCKRWRSVLKSADFMWKCSQVPAQRPWLVAEEYLPSWRSWRVYSPVHDFWFQLPLAELCEDGRLVAAASGLLCFEDGSLTFDELALVLVDPISKHVTRLPWIDPCREIGWETAIALDVVEHSCPVLYRVVLLSYGGIGHTGPGMVTRIYDSNVGNWRVSTSEFPFQASEVVSYTVSGGNVYCLLGNYLGGLRLVAYDICGDSWTDIGTEGLPSLESCRVCRVVGCQSEVMLVIIGARRLAGYIQVFRLDNLHRVWTKLDQFPVNKKFLTGKRTFFHAAGGSKGEVYLLMGKRKSCGNWTGRVVRYDQLAGTCITLEYPRVPGIRRNVGQLHAIVCFEPRWGLCMNTTTNH